MPCVPEYDRAEAARLFSFEAIERAYRACRRRKRRTRNALRFGGYTSRKRNGTETALDRLEDFIRKVTRNYTTRAWHAHLDIPSFFTSIDHDILLAALGRRCPSPTLLWLAERIVRRPIAEDAILRGPRGSFALVPTEKSLLCAPPGKGLPIGNHTSQFFANVYLDALDQYVKRVLDGFLRERLKLALNRRRSKIAPVSSGIDFLGYVVHPRHRLVRRRVLGNFRARLGAFERHMTREAHGYRWIVYRPGRSERLRAVVASYEAHLRKANTWKLRSQIHARFPWVRRALARAASVVGWTVEGLGALGPAATDARALGG